MTVLEPLQRIAKWPIKFHVKQVECGSTLGVKRAL